MYNPNTEQLLVMHREQQWKEGKRCWNNFATAFNLRTSIMI